MSIARIANFFTIVAASGIVLLAGCSAGSWYEGFKRSAEYDCDRQPPGARQDCLSRLNTRTYDDYEGKRSSPKP